MPAQIEHDEYLQVWTFSATDALDLFGLNPEHYEVVKLQACPITEREIERYKPECALFGIKAIKLVDYYTVEIPYVENLSMRTEWHPRTDAAIVRGAFASQVTAIVWAREKLNGMPYTVKPIMRLAAEKPTLELTTNDIIGGE